MILLYILLPLIGAIPLIMVIIKIRNAQRVIKYGIKVEAVVVKIIPWGTSIRNRLDSLLLQYVVEERKEIFQQYATAVPGEKRLGDKMQILYLPENPHKITVMGGKGYIPILIFSILLFLFVIFATVKIGELLAAGGYHLG